MASMKRSETSRLESGTLLRVRARFSASSRSSPATSSGRKAPAAVRGDQRRHQAPPSLDGDAQTMLPAGSPG